MASWATIKTGVQPKQTSAIKTMDVRVLIGPTVLAQTAEVIK